MQLTRVRRHIVAIMVLLHSWILAPVRAQQSDDTANRQKAVQLFQQGKRLEALPLLEELVKANPRDDELLVDLAASLVDHAVTLSDQKAAGQERLRARDLLDRAWKLGNTNPLAMNLSQFLRQLPPSGAIEFSTNPAVEKAMQAGEAAFARRDFDEARKNYSRAMQLQSSNYAAELFIGNTYDRQNNFSKAAEFYQRAIQIDSNVETAYRYYADMLARENDLEAARRMLVKAAIAEPYNRAVWRELHAWARLSDSQINMVYVNVPPEISADSKALSGPSRVSDAWKTYRTTRARWQATEFAKHFPQEQTYRHSLAEEAEALKTAAANLRALCVSPDTAALIAQDRAAVQLLKLYDAGLIEPYVLFSLGDAGIAEDYSSYRENHRGKLENYLNQFVVPPFSGGN
jgi:tetratricopeptide (TPR) repeat protein